MTMVATFAISRLPLADPSYCFLAPSPRWLHVPVVGQEGADQGQYGGGEANIQEPAAEGTSIF
jgi:hypothetical protein